MRTVAPGQKEFTSSVIIVSKGTPKKVLLMYHKKMNSWLQQGGHVEPFENPIDTAIREVKEEAGVDISFLKEGITVVDDLAKELPVPTFLLEEKIPPHKDQPEHFHVDLIYVVEVDEQEVAHNEREAHGIGWFTYKEALKLPLLDNTRTLLERVLTR